MLHRIHQRAEPGDHGGERRDRLELGDDERQCADQHGKRHRGLGDHAELDLTPKEERSNEQSRNDLDQVVVPVGEERQVPVHSDRSSHVGYQVVEPPPQPHADLRLAMQERDRLGVLLDMHEVRPEVGLLVELVVVEPDERPSEQHGQGGAAGGIRTATMNSVWLIDHSTPENATTLTVALLEHEYEREGRRGERANIFRDALVGVREHARGAQAVICSAVEVCREESPSEPLPPEQIQPLLGEGIEGAHER